MRRRDLLKFLLASPIAALTDVEKLLWVPGEKTIFLPTFNETMLYGIPYHQSNAASNVWLGIVREKITTGYLRDLYERDDILFDTIKEGNATIPNRSRWRVPITP